MSGSQLMLNLNTAQMHVGESRPDFRQPHFFPRRDLVAERATELFKPRGLFALLGRALIVRYLSDQIHRGEHRNASFETLADLAPFVGESELSVLTRDMAALAAMCIKNVLGNFALALAAGFHPVQRGHISPLRWLRAWLRLQDDTDTQGAAGDP
jgi:hypothetical protein